MTIAAAVALGDVEQVRSMIAADPAPLKRTFRNGGLLTLAVNHDQIAMVRVLLDLGADVDERVLLEELEELTVSWGAPLWHAARNNQVEIARVLLDRGADPNANVYASGWPLGHTLHHEDGELKRLLLERGRSCSRTLWHTTTTSRWRSRCSKTILTSTRLKNCCGRWPIMAVRRSLRWHCRT